jgi:hypothetical protein
LSIFGFICSQNFSSPPSIYISSRAMAFSAKNLISLTPRQFDFSSWQRIWSA